MADARPPGPEIEFDYRLIAPFRYGQRSIKAIREILFRTPGLPPRPLPA